MIFGSTSGISFEFADGALAGFLVRLGAANPTELRETLTSSAGEPIALPPPSQPETSWTLGGDDWPRPITEIATSRQPFRFGERRIDSRFSISPLDLRRPSPLAHVPYEAVLTFYFEVTTELLWTLQLAPAPRLQSSQGVKLDFGHGVTFEVASNDTQMSLLAAEPGSSRITANLTPGATALELRVQVRPAFDVSDTAVVCRPEQMREAAVVLSGVPGRRYVPLIVLEPPPLPRSRYEQMYAEYRGAVDRTLETTGALAMREDWESVEEIRQYALEHVIQRRKLQEGLLPYRSWAKRNQLLNDAVLRFGVERALFLFDPVPEDLVLFPPERRDTDNEREDDGKSAQSPELFQGVERIVLTTTASYDASGSTSAHDLERLAMSCWSRLAVAGTAQPPWVDADDSAAGVLTGLYTARSEGRLLRLVDGAGRQPAATRVRGDRRADDHVVLVEARQHAQALVGALYAAHLDTAIVVTPAASLVDVESTLDALQRVVVEHAQRGGYAQLVKDLSARAAEFLTGDRRPGAMSNLEAAVTQQVPAEAIDAVGGSRLTAFTSGLPYSFIRTSSADWSEKPIGHVISDGDLIVLSEFCSRGSVPPLQSFNIVVDSGFFDDSETDAVAQGLRRRPSRSIVLRDDPSIPRMVFTLLNELPIEFLFFNTHGSDDAILLGRYPLQSFQIPQWFSLPGRPFVFNNSCLSWIGVGQEFVRVGARGYIGTLWSVDTSDAAEFARTVMHRVMVEGSSISAAMRRTGITQSTARAYIYVGSALADYAGIPGPPSRASCPQMLATLSYYLQALRATRREYGEKRSPSAERLYGDVKALRQALRLETKTSAALIQLILEELELLDQPAETVLASSAERLALIAETLMLLDDAGLDAAQHARTLAKLMFHRARILLTGGNPEEAISVLQEALVAASGDVKLERTIRGELIDLLKYRGRTEEALDIALQAQAAYEKAGEKRALLGILGQITQLLKRMPNRRNEAVSAARRGEELARAQQDRTEEATFALDAAQLLLGNGNASEALAAAERALRLFRRQNSTVGELAAYGTLGQAYRELGKLDSARKYATLGLERAKELGESARVGVFLADLSGIADLEGNSAEAGALELEGIDVAAASGAVELWAGMVGLILRRVAAEASAPLCVEAVEKILATVNRMGGESISGIVPALVHTLVAVYPRLNATLRVAMLVQIAQRIDAVAQQVGQGEAIQYVTFAGDIVKMLALAAIGEREKALQLALELDRASRSVMQLAETVRRLAQ
jgi:tetratricopeptide (TPR) repeat protein